jgi:hypothetical protein
MGEEEESRAVLLYQTGELSLNSTVGICWHAMNSLALHSKLVPYSQPSLPSTLCPDQVLATRAWGDSTVRACARLSVRYSDGFDRLRWLFQIPILSLSMLSGFLPSDSPSETATAIAIQCAVIAMIRF